MNRSADKETVRRVTVVALAALLAPCRCVFALNPALDVNQYAHTSWKIREGFTKGAITAIAQARDGYVWLGTEFGLFKFDGVRNVAWQPPGGQHLPSEYVLALIAARDGTLWIGTSRGLASWNGRRVTNYAELNGSVSRILEAKDGSIWVTVATADSRQLCGLADGRIACDSGRVLASGVFGLFEDRNGALWAGVRNGVWRWKPDPAPFVWSDEPNGIQGMADGDNGALLMSTRGEVKRLVGGRVETAYRFPESSRRFQAPRMLRDRDGGLWVGTLGGGLVHMHRGRTDVFAHRDGLSSDTVRAIYQDREGNVWVATDGGLDKFREAAISTLGADQGLSNERVISVVAGKDGSLWIGTFEGLNRFKDGEVHEIVGPGMPEHGVHAMHEDDRGRLWIATGRGFGYLERNRFVSVGPPQHLTNTYAIAEDSHAIIWAANLEHGLVRMESGGAFRQVPLSAMGRDGDVLTTLVADRANGGVWLGFERGGIAYWNGDHIERAYRQADGLGRGRVSAFLPEPDGTLWVATEGGLTRLHHGRVATIASKNGLPCDVIHSAVEDDAHAFWMDMPCGLVRVARAEIMAAAGAIEAGQRASDVIHPIIFDSSDGVELTADRGFYGPHVAKSTDGRLWFAGLNRVSIVDPGRLPINALPPPVHVEDMIADHETFHVPSAASAGMRLPPLLRDLQIDYTALSLVAPEKMRFRYRLDGFDRDWQDAGNRRQAFYTNLPPRSYRFRVIAANDSGVWNETGASIDFSIAPAYYQTTWFLGLSVASIVAFVWAGYRLRVRMLEQHECEISALNERLMKAQEQERIRIAGELHDSVMQQVAGVTLMLGTARRRINDDSGAKATIENVQQKLIRVGTEIRQLSHDLHPPVLQEAGLAKAVEAYCHDFSTTSRIPVTCDADERAGDLSPGAALALFRIVQEALGNAARHAAATHITVSLTRLDGTVSLTVSDNGNGFDRTRLGSGRGLGLIMMRERATQLNGEFHFDSAPGQGTSIRVVIPFR